MAIESVATDAPATVEFCSTQTFEALLTDSDVKDIEDGVRAWSVHRRLALAVMTRSKAQLVESMSSDETIDSALAFFEDLSGYINHLRGQIEMAEVAQTRLLVTLSSVQREAESPL